jgi:hypothetical protein
LAAELKIIQAFHNSRPPATICVVYTNQRRCENEVDYVNVRPAKGMLLTVDTQELDDGLCGVDADIAGVVRGLFIGTLWLFEGTREERPMEQYRNRVELHAV